MRIYRIYVQLQYRNELKQIQWPPSPIDINYDYLWLNVQRANLLSVALRLVVVSFYEGGCLDGGLYVELFADGFGCLGGGVKIRVHEERVACRLLSADDLPVAQQELAIEREPLAFCLRRALLLQNSVLVGGTGMRDARFILINVYE